MLFNSESYAALPLDSERPAWAVSAERPADGENVIPGGRLSKVPPKNSIPAIESVSPPLSAYKASLLPAVARMSPVLVVEAGCYQVMTDWASAQRTTLAPASRHDTTRTQGKLILLKLK